MVEDYGIQLIQMMENAGRHGAILAQRRFFNGNPSGKKALITPKMGKNGLNFGSIPLQNGDVLTFKPFRI
jgi:hypothetical protein